MLNLLPEDQRIHSRELKERTVKGEAHVLVDVQPAHHFKIVSLPNAMNIPLSSLESRLAEISSALKEEEKREHGTLCFTSSQLFAALYAFTTSRTPERYHRPLLLNSQYPIYGCLIYSFLRPPPPPRQQRIIIAALHPHLIDQLQSSRKSFSLKNLCESAVSHSTMSYKVSFSSRSNGGYTESGLVPRPRGSTSTSHPVRRSGVNAHNPSISKSSVIKEAMNNPNPSLHCSSNGPQVQPVTNKGITRANSYLKVSSFDPFLWSNIPSLQSMEGNFTGADTSLEVYFKSTSKVKGSSHGESGAEMRCDAPLQNSLLYAGVQSIKTYSVPTLDNSHRESGLTGAKLSCDTPLRNSLLYDGVQSFKTYPMPISGSSHRESDLTGAKMSCDTPLRNCLLYAGVQSIKTYSVPTGGSSHKESGLTGAEMSCDTPSRNSLLYADIQSSKTYPVSTLGHSYRESDLTGAKMSCDTSLRNSLLYAGVQSIKTYPMSILGISHRESDLTGAKMSCDTPLRNSLLYTGVQSIKTYPMPTLGNSHRESGLIGAKMSCDTPL
uniref:Rhodanese domain-containing protein n=1 Tax=Populus alba TaxID=43335 RepID=A0A4U5QI50_POPAL|nr:hypothetical protein D5086_0000083660 [Populus alba]